MTPSEKLPQRAIDRLNTNTYKSFVLEHLPKSIPETAIPKASATCANCQNSIWTATETDLKGYCAVFHAFIHTKTDPAKLVICDRNIPEAQGTAEADESPT